MKILETIVASAIVGLIISICNMYAAKRLIKSEKEEIFDEILDYLGTPEGQQSVRNLGTLFSQGISKGIGLGGSALKGKTFGVPNVIIARILDQYMPKKTGEAISKEQQGTPSDSFG